MKTSQFEQFIRIGAFDTIVIFDSKTSGLGYAIYGYHFANGTTEDLQLQKEVDRSGNSIEAARGGRRTWKDLDRAYEFIRSAGWTGKIEIDG